MRNQNEEGSKGVDIPLELRPGHFLREAFHYFPPHPHPLPPGEREM